MQKFLYEKPVSPGTQRSNHFLISTNDLCLICLKDCGSANCLKEGKTLCRILTRYFGVNLMVPELALEWQRKGLTAPSPTEKAGIQSDCIHFLICQDCSMLANKLSQLFQQLEATQMQLHAHGQNLCDIMKSAEKVPRRVSHFHERLSWPGEKPEGMTKMIAESVRKEVMRKCGLRSKSRKRSRMMIPTIKVVLARNPCLENALSLYDFPPLSPTQIPHHTIFLDAEEGCLGLLGCTISLWIVILLSLLDVESIISKQQRKIASKNKIYEDKGVTITIVDSPPLEEIPDSSPLEEIPNSSPLEEIPNSSPLEEIPDSSPLEESLNSPPLEESLNSPPLEEILESSHLEEIASHCKLEIHSPKYTMILRKRKACDDSNFGSIIDCENKKPLLVVTPPQTINEIVNETTPVTDESTDEASEEDIVKEKFLRSFEKISMRMKTRGSPSKYRKNDQMGTKIQLSALITPEEALSAVKAIRLPTPQIREDVKIMQVHEESEVELLFLSGTKEENTSEVQNDCARGPTKPSSADMKNFAVIPPISPIEIKFVETPVDSSHPRAYSERITKIPERGTGSGYTCHICYAYFDSRAKVEKHRAVNHKLKKYVQCPHCLEMFASYYDLEFHRNCIPKCRIDDYARELEMKDIARPLFPPESEIMGSHFCPVENCYEVFHDVKKLNLHLKVHGNFQCRFGCKQIFGKGSDLAVHEINNHQYGILTPNIFKCPRCDYITEQKDGYLTHFIYKHLNISPYADQCGICQRAKGISYYDG